MDSGIAYNQAAANLVSLQLDEPEHTAMLAALNFYFIKLLTTGATIDMVSQKYNVTKKLVRETLSKVVPEAYKNDRIKQHRQKIMRPRY